MDLTGRFTATNVMPGNQSPPIRLDTQDFWLDHFIVPALSGVTMQCILCIFSTNGFENVFENTLHSDTDMIVACNPFYFLFPKEIWSSRLRLWWGGQSSCLDCWGKRGTNGISLHQILLNQPRTKPLYKMYKIICLHSILHSLTSLTCCFELIQSFTKPRTHRNNYILILSHM